MIILLRLPGAACSTHLMSNLKNFSRYQMALPPGVSEVMCFLSNRGIEDPTIGGGCLRNTALKVGFFSDIDVALHAAPRPTQDPAEAFFEQMRRRNPKGVDYGLLQRGIRAAQHTLHVDGFETDITFYSVKRTVQERIGRFSVGISGIGMDSDGQVWVSDAFQRDMQEHTLTLINGTRGLIGARNIGYAARLQRQYFPTHTIVDGTISDREKRIVKRPLVP